VEFTPEHASWIEELPAMARVGQALLLHADSTLYINFGASIETLNKAFHGSMRNRELLPPWELALSAFGEHMAFSELEMTGTQRTRQILGLYGGDTLIHGHTPIPYTRRTNPTSVIEHWTYCDGACINVDGGIYMGAPGFVYELPD